MDENRLITGEIYGPTGRFRRGANNKIKEIYYSTRERKEDLSMFYSVFSQGIQ